MRTQGEKSKSAMGFVVSVLLHGIFLAGCLALDASSLSISSDDQKPTEIHRAGDISASTKVKS